jgi:hypothetical protein
MIPVTHKLVAVTPPAAIVDNAAYTTTAVDTLGFRFARFVVFLGATDIAMAGLKVQESDDSGMSGAADITGAVFGTSANDTGSTSAVPSATDDNKFFTVEIDLRGRKRYLDLVGTAGDGAAGTFLVAWCELYRGETIPTTAAQKGVDENLRVPAL